MKIYQDWGRWYMNSQHARKVISVQPVKTHGCRDLSRLGTYVMVRAGRQQQQAMQGHLCGAERDAAWTQRAACCCC